jgi:protein-S-isoprenylcysteine O-methyltransferase Ste14
MVHKLLLVPWFMGVLYSSIPLFWFAIHPLAGRWRKMNKSPYRALLPLAALIIVGLAWASWPWHAVRVYTKWWTWELALPFFAVGIRTYSRIRLGFGRKLTGEAEVRPEEHEQKLVTTGLHARMRHPIYFAHLCNLSACAIGSGLLEPFVFLAVSLFLTFPLMIWLEERELEKRFGQSYRDYKREVPLVPFLFSAHTYKKVSA